MKSVDDRMKVMKIALEEMITKMAKDTKDTKVEITQMDTKITTKIGTMDT